MQTFITTIAGWNRRYPGMMWGMSIVGAAGLLAGPLPSLGLTAVGAVLGLAVDLLRHARSATGR